MKNELQILQEMFAFAEYWKLFCSPVYYGIGVPHEKSGHNNTILLLPGLFAIDYTLLPMAFFLKRIGYNPKLAGVGYNLPWKSTTDYISSYVEELIKENENIRIIGHSLGGFQAEEIVRRYPQSIDEIIRLGTPISSKNPEETLHWLVAALVRKAIYYDPNSIYKDLLSKAEIFGTSSKLPDRVKGTSIFTKLDGIVNYEYCIDHNPNSNNYLLLDGGTHCGLIFNPLVYSLIAHELQNLPYKHKFIHKIEDSHID